MGVAVITRTSAAAPLSPRFRRWCTPNRCCSSITVRAKSLKTTSSVNRACVPIMISIWPCAKSSRIACLGLPLLRPVRIWMRIGRSLQNAVNVSRCCRAKISVGTIKAACPRLSTAASMAVRATTVLPLPTSPCKRRSMRMGFAISDWMSCKTSCCPSVNIYGRAAASLRRKPPSPLITRPARRRAACRIRARAS